MPNLFLDQQRIELHIAVLRYVFPFHLHNPGEDAIRSIA
jgi:hypothetical protein